MKAVIYARFSSHAQKDASIEQQLADCRDFARRNEITVIGEYCDHALTGTTDKRPEFLRMIRDASKEKWSAVLIWKTDRFARNRYDSAMYKAKLKKHHVRVISVKEAIPDGPEGILLESILEGSAEYYSANLSQNVTRGMRDNALKCKANGTLATGYVRGADGRYEIDPNMANIIREIFEAYAAGSSITSIIASLNARGLRTSRGTLWNKNSLQRILSNENYVGVYHWGDTRIEGGVPAIVSREIFYAAQEHRKRMAWAPSASRADVDYLLTGKIFCGLCKRPLIGFSGTGQSGKKYNYYRCVGHRDNLCEKKAIRKDFIEKKIVADTKMYCLSDPMIKVIVDSAIELQEKERKNDDALVAYENELNSVNKSIRNIMNAIEQGIITPSTKERLIELEMRKDELECAIAEEKIEKPILTRDQLTYWLERFRDGDPDDPEYRATFIEVFVSAVYIYDDGYRIACNFNKEDGMISFSFINEIEAQTEHSEEVFVYAPGGGPAQN